MMMMTAMVMTTCVAELLGPPCEMIKLFLLSFEEKSREHLLLKHWSNQKYESNRPVVSSVVYLRLRF